MAFFLKKKNTLLSMILIIFDIHPYSHTIKPKKKMMKHHKQFFYFDFFLIKETEKTMVI